MMIDRMTSVACPRPPGRTGFTCGGLLLLAACLILSIEGQRASVLADETEALEIITDESPRSGALFAARTMAIRYETIAEKPVVFTVDMSGNSALETYLDREPDGSVLLFTHHHLVEMLSDPDGHGLDDITLLARGITIPQVLVSRCDRFVNAAEILDPDRRNRIRFGTIDGLAFDVLTVRALWQQVHGTEPIVQTVADSTALIKALDDERIDIVVLSLTAAADRLSLGSYCLRLLLSGTESGRYPNLPTAASLGVPVSVARFGGYALHQDGDADAIEDLERTLTDSMRNVAYEEFLAYSGLESGSVAGSTDWREALDGLVRTLAPVLSAEEGRP